ncbi:hypothetical protein BURKHO8Y_100003 [Burkholderia sp. 8Y]|nr:hypothetical protein BURKHO8Y_100003 [Burkholderia sp. 8Y]
MPGDFQSGYFSLAATMRPWTAAQHSPLAQADRAPKRVSEPGVQGSDYLASAVRAQAPPTSPASLAEDLRGR